MSSTTPNGKPSEQHADSADLKGPLPFDKWLRQEDVREAARRAILVARSRRALVEQVVGAKPIDA